ncbi:hypothetical protein D3C80_1385130 [compost metagenome]
MALGGPPQPRPAVEQQHQPLPLRAGEQRDIAGLQGGPALLRGLVESLGLQHRQQHFEVAQRPAEAPDVAERRLQLIDPGHAMHRMQQAAQAPHGDAQIVQRLAVRTGLQANGGGEQGNFLFDDVGDQIIAERGHGTLLRR